MTALPNPFFAPAEGVVPAGDSSPPNPTLVGTSNSRACASQSPGPSLATGMSRDPANTGGEHEEAVTSSFITSALSLDEAPPALENTSLNAGSASGTAPAASGPERDIFGAANPELAKVSCVDPSGSPQRMSPSRSGCLVSDARNHQASNSSSCGGVEGHAATMALTAPERPAGDNGAEASASLCRPRAGIKPGPQDSFKPSFQPDFEKLFNEIMGPT